MLETLERLNSRRTRTGSSAMAELKADEALIQRVVCNDPAAKDEFVRRYARLIQVILHKSGITREDQEDLFVQVFEHLWDRKYRCLRKWKATSRFSAFLGVVVQNLINDHLRYQARHGHISTEDCQTFAASVPETFEQLLYTRQQKEAVDHVLCQLSPRDSEIIQRRHYIGQSYRDISDRLNVNVKAIGVYLTRAEKRLQKRLLEEFPDLFEYDSYGRP